MSSNKKHYNGAKTPNDQRRGESYVQKNTAQVERQRKKIKFDDNSNNIDSENAVHNTQTLVKIETNVSNVEKGEKVAYNPLLHSTNIVDEFTSKRHCRKRYRKRDKQTDKKK